MRGSLTKTRTAFAALAVGVGALSWVLGYVSKAKYGLFADKPTPWPVGFQLPNGVVHENRGAAFQFADVIDRSGHTVVAIVTPGCATCIAEAAVWQEIAEQWEGRGLSMVAIVVTPDPNFITSLRTSSRAEFPMYRTGEEFRKRMRSWNSPTIYVVDFEGRVIFQNDGPGATGSVERWLADEPFLLGGG